MKSAKIRKVISDLEDLPTLPRIVLRITELVNNPKCSAQDLARVITDDQVLTARLLRLVNSSFYGFPQKISTVTGAIVLLGFDAIRNLLLSTSILELFRDKGKKKRSKGEDFWDHSLGCAVAAKVIGEFLGNEKGEELFVAGLLHDIGKIVEMLFLPEEFAEITSLVEEKDVLMVVAEKEVLDYTHMDIGRLLAEKWNLPEKFIEVITHHHSPEKADGFSQETAIVHLADILVRALEIGWGGDNKIPVLNKTAWKILGLELSDIEFFMERIEVGFSDINVFAADSKGN